MTKHLITDAELDAALYGTATETPPSPARAQWVADLADRKGAALPLDELLELAAETQPEGTLATIQALLRGLIIRHQGDDATLAALVAIERLHLPELADQLSLRR